MSSKVKSVASKVISKWLKKGNMARAMRDILPTSGLKDDERENVVAIVHHVVRFKKLYDFALDSEKMERNPKNYVWLFFHDDILNKYRKIAVKNNMTDVYFSASKEVARVLQLYPKFTENINREKSTHIALNIRKIKRDDAVEILKKEGFKANYCNPETCISANSSAKYSSIIKNGLGIVQDSSSQHLSKLVSSLGSEILDFCAGSGGKSFTVKFFNPAAKVKVHDANEKKLQSLFNRAEKLGLEIEKFEFSGEFDVVLVDAPCSGLGSAARNPEAKYQENLQKYPKMQMEILNEAKKYVKPSGFLVYSVCTFNPDETYLLVEKFLDENSEFEEIELGDVDFIVRERRGFFITSGDVIYAAILRRRE